jgi:hypothetical protein
MPQIKVGSPEHVKLWAAINVYAETCGGDTSSRTISDHRMKAVVVIEQALQE